MTLLYAYSPAAAAAEMPVPKTVDILENHVSLANPDISFHRVDTRLPFQNLLTKLLYSLFFFVLRSAAANWLG
jgi:hypothetical protein